MLKKILAFFLLAMLLIAVFLKLNGVDNVGFDDTYYKFMQSVLQRTNAFSFAIPDIPLIPSLATVGGFWDIVNVLVTFANGIINLLNLLVTLLNVLLSVLQFIVGFVIEVINQLRNLIIS